MANNEIKQIKIDSTTYDIAALKDEDGNSIKTTYQKSTDNNLVTTSKTIPGAINELNAIAHANYSHGLEYEFHDWHYDVVGYGNCEQDEIINIPPIHNGYPVLAIMDYALANNPYVMEITIPDSVFEIHEGAFEDCVTLNKIYIPKGTHVVDASICNECPHVTIYTEYENEDSALAFGWSSEWNEQACPVVWGSPRDVFEVGDQFNNLRNQIGDIDSALDELHTYAQNIING